LQELVEVDKSNKPISTQPLNNHRHNQLLMEAVEVVVEAEEEEEAAVVEVHQHLHQHPQQQPLLQQHPKEESTAP